MFCRAGKWFVAFSCEVEKPEPPPKTGESIGIDLGLVRLATFSTGEKKENPRWYRGILRELRVLQRKIARCVMGSGNRRRLIGRLRRMMVHVANARKDFLNKFVHELVARFDRIVLEDLRVATLPSILVGPSRPLRQEHPGCGLVLPCLPSRAQG